MSQLIGVLILAGLGLGMVWFAARDVGIRAALVIWGGSLLLTALICLGTWLALGGAS